MKKIIIIGCPGSGKSTFSIQLQKISNLPLFHLDLLNWNADKTTVAKELFHKRLDEVLKKDCWIIDGNYGSTMEKRLQQCDTVFFLDYSTDVCLTGISERKGKVRVDIPWVDNTDEDDEDFISFVYEYSSIHRPKVLNLLSHYPAKEIHIFQNRTETNEYLERLEDGILYHASHTPNLMGMLS